MALRRLLATISLALATYSSSVFSSDIVIKVSTLREAEILLLYQTIYGHGQAQKKWREHFFSPFDAQNELEQCLRIAKAVKNQIRSAACEKALSLFESR